MLPHPPPVATRGLLLTTTDDKVPPNPPEATAAEEEKGNNEMQSRRDREVYGLVRLTLKHPYTQPPHRGALRGRSQVVVTRRAPERVDAPGHQDLTGPFAQDLTVTVAAPSLRSHQARRLYP